MPLESGEKNTLIDSTSILNIDCFPSTCPRFKVRPEVAAVVILLAVYPPSATTGLVKVAVRMDGYGHLFRELNLRACAKVATGRATILLIESVEIEMSAAGGAGGDHSEREMN